MRTCAHCGEVIPKTRGNAAKYCSEKCARLSGLTPEIRKKITERSCRKSKRDPKLLAAYGYKCARCGWGLPQWLPCYTTTQHAGGCEMHHIIAVKDGGTEDNDNLVLLCPNCHKEAHVGLISQKELQRLTIPKDETENRWNTRRLQNGGEMIIEKLFEKLFED